MARAKIERISAEEKEFHNCPICLKPIKKLLKRTGCNHCFHPRCLNNWTERCPNCPLCRSDIYVPKKKHSRKNLVRNLEREFQEVTEEQLVNINPGQARVTVINDFIFVEDNNMILYFNRHEWT